MQDSSSVQNGYVGVDIKPIQFQQRRLPMLLVAKDVTVIIELHTSTFFWETWRWRRFWLLSLEHSPISSKQTTPYVGDHVPVDGKPNSNFFFFDVGFN